MCSPESLHYFCLWDRRHTRNWKIVFQVRSVWYSTSSSYLCQASSLRGKITQDWLFGLKWDPKSVLVWQEVSRDLLPSIFTSLSRGWFTQKLESGCGQKVTKKDKKWNLASPRSRSEQAPESVFHPRDESEKNYCEFLGTSWCNIKVDPEW